MPRFYDALMIDLDGTLVDTMGDFVAVLHACLREMQLPSIDESVVRTMVGKGSEHLILSVMAHIVPHWEDLAQTQRNAFLQRAKQLYQVHYPRINGQHSQLFPGVLDGLRDLQALGLPMACLTNKPDAFARPLLEAKGIASYFRFVFGGDSFAHKKPHPEPLSQTCLALHTTPARTLMVGDSSNDALAAQAAGCPCALVTYGYNHGEDIRLCAHQHLLQSLHELALIC